MAQPFSSLTLYRLREKLDGSKATKFEDFIAPDKRAASLTLNKRYEFDARLFIASPTQSKGSALQSSISLHLPWQPNPREV
jgi:hypothetical protein